MQKAATLAKGRLEVLAETTRRSEVRGLYVCSYDVCLRDFLPTLHYRSIEASVLSKLEEECSPVLRI